jgi:glutathione S-transferase
MLELKGIDYRLMHVLPGNQRIHLRLAGFRGGTVPALKLDGRRIQGSVPIARELERLVPEPPLYPAARELRRRAEEAERWGDEELQNVPRRIMRWGLRKDAGLRRWLAEQDAALPLPALAARLTGPVSIYYARLVRADNEHVRRDVAQLPATLDRIERLMADGVITEPPNAATFQVLCSVRSLLGFSDFVAQVEERPFAALARRLFPHYPEAPVPPFVERLGAA